ncbi:5'-3' exoribonuclease 3 isoform B [Glycine soja]|uniref:5'-3' exoribonuclease 3 isoform B n=1 Tax=Glycine soja TaxID=3848 RepID=A0A445GTQ1_GLYSO|nr:5'-3' exoribonuclease 3 isoform B [Glycine soja]
MTFFSKRCTIAAAAAIELHYSFQMHEIVKDTCSGGMNGYISLYGGEPCPPIFRSLIASMEDIMDNHVICAIYRLPDAHKHISRPPQGVKFLKKIVEIGDLKLEPVLWHEDSGRRHHSENGR